MARPRRFFRIAGAGLVAAGVVVCAMLLVGLFRPMSISLGRVGVGVGRGDIAIGWGNCDVVATWPAGQSLPSWVVGGTGAQIRLAPRSSWTPSISDASVSVTTTGASARTMLLKVLWVPLWWPGVVLLPLGGLLWTLGAKCRDVQACGACGYSLLGLAGGRCPECGAGVGE